MVKEKFQGVVVNGDTLRQGRYLYFFDNGVLNQEGFYTNGKPDSVWITYYPSGARLSLFHYKSGKKDGPFLFWNSDGTLYQQGYYKNDLLDGVLETYYPNGKLSAK